MVGGIQGIWLQEFSTGRTAFDLIAIILPFFAPQVSLFE
jgi:hypothetical protein